MDSGKNVSQFVEHFPPFFNTALVPLSSRLSVANYYLVNRHIYHWIIQLRDHIDRFWKRNLMETNACLLQHFSFTLYLGNLIELFAFPLFQNEKRFNILK